MTAATPLRAPFPWFGGKSRVAHLVWDAFGADVPNYVEPFAGSLAVLLGRPDEPRIETVNDISAMVSNFWRALQADPEAVAHHADWPVNEVDLRARHVWLVKRLPGMRERLMADAEYFDAKVAGWWVWGICQWIGHGWVMEGAGYGGGISQQRPTTNVGGILGQRGTGGRRIAVGNRGGGIHAVSLGKRPALSKRNGVHAPPPRPEQKRPVLGRGSRGVLLGGVFDDARRGL